MLKRPRPFTSTNTTQPQSPVSRRTGNPTVNLSGPARAGLIVGASRAAPYGRGPFVGGVEPDHGRLDDPGVFGLRVSREPSSSLVYRAGAVAAAGP
jgi:hypothetical protein